jgi:H+/Cl- antiporter ClcA
MTTTQISESLSQPKVTLDRKPKPISLSDRLTGILNRLQLSPESLMLISALLIGGGSGLAMATFHFLINFFQTLSYEILLNQISVWGSWTLVCIPISGGVVVGFMRWLNPDFLGHGFAALLSSVREPKMYPLRPIEKMLAAAVSLGTGSSLGPEGPSVEISANIGVLLGQAFQVSQERYRLLVGAGAAAGLAAGFNAPIAGVFFALELVLGMTFSTPAVSLILLSAVVSAIVTHVFFGVHPAFELPAYQVLSNWEWIFYLGLGLLASIVSLLYTESIKFFEACFQGKIVCLRWMGKLSPSLYPVIGGACVGLVALYIPDILGIGYNTLETILEGGEFPLYFLCLLLLVKLLATAVSFGSGLVGGIFAPALFLGACLGAIYGNVLANILPPGLLEIGPPAAYAMVGMAAVLAASVRAPLTAILLMFELTRNYLIILPLMAAVGVSVWLVEQIKSRQAVQGLKLPQMGLNLEKQNELEVLEQMTIATLMEPSYLALPSSMSLLEAGYRMIQEKCHTALVLDKTEQLVGIVSLVDLKRRITQPILESTSESPEIKRIWPKLEDICTKDIIYTYASESVTEVLERMELRGLYLLPVVAPDNPRQVLGVIEKNKISLAGELAMAQEALRPYLKLKEIKDIV